jgi:hypothetical protein
MLKTFFYLILLFTSSITIFSNQVYFTLIKEHKLSSSGTDIVISDGIAYVLTASSLHGFSTTEPFDATGVDYSKIGGLKSIGFAGRMAFVLGNQSGIVIYDLTTNSAVKKTSISTNGTVNKIAVDNGYLYTLNEASGLQVYDVNIVDFPVFRNTQIIPGSNANGIFIKDKKAYVTSTGPNLSIFNAADVSTLPIVGSYTNGVKFFEPYVDGNYAYLPQGSTGVQVLDISKLPFPEWITNLYARKSAKQVVASNFYVWVADDKSVECFFQRDAKAFYFAGNYKNDKVINRIAQLDGKYLMLATADKKLKVLRIDYKY